MGTPTRSKKRTTGSETARSTPIRDRINDLMDELLGEKEKYENLAEEIGDTIDKLQDVLNSLD